MHNLAIALHLKGATVTGSDDEIFDPARSRLARYGLLPADEGWHPERITRDLDAVVLGMHARQDNPELLRAQELGIKIYSYPEYLYEQSKDKTRIVIGGSHGKTTTTAMILHVLSHCGIDADYMVGAQLEGFEVMVKLSKEARVMVIEGDEYLTSPIDRRPKFHLYRPNVAIITGIEWDHVNVFPTFEIYKQQFARFVELIEPNGTLVYCNDDTEVADVARSCRRTDISKVPYDVPQYTVGNGITSLVTANGTTVPLRIFGRHNLLNLTAARYACNAIGIADEQFDAAIQTFGGASKRLELVLADEPRHCAVYKDFAHAPSKLRATVGAMREQYPDRRLIACMELHTFSSLTADFLTHYRGCMQKADIAVVYFNPHAVAHKHLPPLSVEQVKEAFGNNVAFESDEQSELVRSAMTEHRLAKQSDIKVFDNSALMLDYLRTLYTPQTTNQNLLMMSSGNFDGLDFNTVATELLG